MIYSGRTNYNSKTTIKKGIKSKPYAFFKDIFFYWLKTTSGLFQPFQSENPQP